jgi:hypothetical protein
MFPTAATDNFSGVVLLRREFGAEPGFEAFVDVLETRLGAGPLE